eukprot:g1524.t1
MAGPGQVMLSRAEPEAGGTALHEEMSLADQIAEHHRRSFIGGDNQMKFHAASSSEPRLNAVAGGAGPGGGGGGRSAGSKKRKKRAKRKGGGPRSPNSKQPIGDFMEQTMQRTSAIIGAGDDDDDDSSSNEGSKPETVWTIERLKQQGDSLTRRIAEENYKAGELERQASVLRKRLKDKGNQLRFSAAQEDDALKMIAKAKHMLEEKRDKQRIRLNKVQAKNSDLKKVVDDYRLKKLQNEEIAEALRGDVAAGKLEVIKTAEEGSRLTEAEEALQTKAQVVRERIRREGEEFKVRMDALTGEIEDRSLKVSTCISRPVILDKSVTSPDAAAAGAGEGSASEIESAWDSTSFSKGSPGGTGAMEVVNEASLDHLLAVTKSTGIEALIEDYKGVDTQNFSLFNYINNMSAENDALDAKISRLKIEVSRYKGRDSEQAQIREEAEKKLEARLHHKLDIIESKAKTVHGMEKDIASLGDAILSCFRKIGCDVTKNDDHQDLLLALLNPPSSTRAAGDESSAARPSSKADGRARGTSSRPSSKVEARTRSSDGPTLTPKAILPVLGLIEQRAQEIICMFCATRHARGAGGGGGGGGGGGIHGAHPTGDDPDALVGHNAYVGPAYPAAFVDGGHEFAPHFLPESTLNDDSDLSDEYENPETGEICAKPLPMGQIVELAKEKLLRDDQAFRQRAGVGADGGGANGKHGGGNHHPNNNNHHNQHH